VSNLVLGAAGMTQSAAPVAWGGCFDVFCWRAGAILFAESKWHRHDAIRPTQRAWLETALNMGFR
jgi:hypothetical protein